MLGSGPLSGAPLASSFAQITVASLNHGSFTLTGQSADLNKFLKVGLDHGSFTLTGQTANLFVEDAEVIGTLLFDLTGQDAAFAKALKLTADAGSFTLTGIDNVFNITVPFGAHGSFTLTGQDATFAIKSSFDHGSFTLTGQNINFAKSVSLDAGSFTLTGQDATMVVGFPVTGLEMTLGLGNPTVFGLIIPDQTPSYSTITPSQNPVWTEVA